MYHLVLFVALSFGPPVPQPKDPAGVAKLVAQLGADDFDTRRAAEEALGALVAKDPGAARSLVRAANRPDPEVAHRANRILRAQFDAADFGGGGHCAPRLVDAAGRRNWVYADGGVRWLPEAGPILELAERYGRLVMTERGETVGERGTKESDDPLDGAVQSLATVRLCRDLQLAGVRPAAIKKLVAAIEEMAQPDDGP